MASPVLLRDVAEVKVAPALRSGDALVMGRPGVMLSLASQYGANTLTTTLAVEQALAELTPALKAQGITLYPACIGRRISSSARSGSRGSRCSSPPS